MKFSILSIVVGLTISFILIFFLVVPAYHDYNKLREDIVSSQNELRNNNKGIADIEQNYKKLENYKEAEKKIDYNFKAGSSLPSMFYFIQTQASEHGLHLKQISSEVPTSLVPKMESTGGGKKAVSAKKAEALKNPYSGLKEKLQKTAIKASLFGSYDSFKDFLAEIETSARLIDIEKVSFSSPGRQEGGGSNSFPFFIKMDTYSR